MRQTSFKTVKRMLAGAVSAALLATSTAFATVPAPVKAADNDYYEALALSLYFYDANACGSDVGEGPLTWRGDCHVEDEKALISNATNFDSSCTSLVDPDGDGKVDVGGGYHDAGDHIKFNLTMGFGFSSLAMSEYLNPGIYDKAGCRDHLNAICKRNAEYLMKTTFLDASGNVATVCAVVADGGTDHSMMTPPEEQHYDRATYWLTAGNNNTAICAEMASALAGAAYLLKSSDPSFAAECVKYAKALLAFGKNHKGNYLEGTAPYYSLDAMNEDEVALAEAWLYVIDEGSKPSLTPSNGMYSGVADYYRYTWDKVWQGYAAMMYKKTNDNVFKSELEFEVNNAGGVAAGKYNGDGWGAARYNCALQMSALAIANGDKSSSYATGSKWQMDYILGGNPLGYSFLIGYGSKWPTHIHHRAANPGDLSSNPEAKYTLYGCLVGGIDASGNYEDHSDKYQYTEGALDYNGCFALACAGLANLFGGSDKGAANIASSASEIKYPYSFGSSSIQQPTESTEQTTETTTATTQNGGTTQTTATTVTTQQPKEGEASYTEKKNENNQTYWTFNVAGAQKLQVTFDTNSNDTEANGVFNPPGGWNPEKWSASAAGGQFTIEYEVPAGQSTVDVYVWWPETATISKAVLVGGTATTEVTTTTTKATTVQTTTSTTVTTIETTQQPLGDIIYGDADCNGTVDLLDVVFLNKNLLGMEKLSSKGALNANVDRNNSIDSTDSLNILKSLVSLVTLPV